MSVVHNKRGNARIT